MITDEDFRDAFDRIARTPDGRLAYLYLQKRLMAVLTESKSSALRADNGERKFASHLMGLMAKGIEDSGGREHEQQRPNVFAIRQPTAVRPGQRGAGRRVGPEPGDDEA